MELPSDTKMPSFLLLVALLGLSSGVQAVPPVAIPRAEFSSPAHLNAPFEVFENGREVSPTAAQVHQASEISTRGNLYVLIGFREQLFISFYDVIFRKFAQRMSESKYRVYYLPQASSAQVTAAISDPKATAVIFAGHGNDVGKGVLGHDGNYLSADVFRGNLLDFVYFATCFGNRQAATYGLVGKSDGFQNLFSVKFYDDFPTVPIGNSKPAYFNSISPEDIINTINRRVPFRTEKEFQARARTLAAQPVPRPSAPVYNTKNTPVVPWHCDMPGFEGSCSRR